MTRVDVRLDDGAGVVLVVTMMTLVVAVASAVMMVLGAVARYERIQIAADTAASAAVAAALAGDTDPCAFAARGVDIQQLRLVSCTPRGEAFEVAVDEPTAPPLFRRVATARAGLVSVQAP
jgi:secretion/DNA translocation related TadE-like protein